MESKISVKTEKLTNKIGFADFCSLWGKNVKSYAETPFGW